MNIALALDTSAGSRLSTALRGYTPGHNLQAEFYNDEGIFAADFESIVVPGWHLADHASRIPNRGDYFTFEIGLESLIVVRDGSGSVNAFYNVCRHRGSRICTAAQGSRKSIVCPYHAWTYGLDGRLVAVPNDAGRSKDEFGLRRASVAVVEGIIFVSLEPDAPTFVPDEAMLRLLKAHGVGTAKIAARKHFPTVANWKLVVENFLECYHCGPAHPEYSRISSPAVNASFSSRYAEGMPEHAKAEFESLEERCEMAGVPAFQPVFSLETQSFVVRKPLRNGFLTPSRDGKPVALLMGEFRSYDGGSTVIGFNVFSYMSGYSDHAVLYRFTPRSAELTDVEALWLVSSEAVEGKDYQVSELTWLWSNTLAQDKELVVNNQLGTKSRAYSTTHYEADETLTRDFVAWYVHRVRKFLSSGAASA